MLELCQIRDCTLFRTPESLKRHLLHLGIRDYSPEPLARVSSEWHFHFFMVTLREQRECRLQDFPKSLTNSL